MRMLFTVALVGAAFTFPVLADSGTSAPPAPNPDQIVCVRKPAPTGSFLTPKPECHTRAEWQAHPNGFPAEGGANDVHSYGSVDPSGHGNATP